MAGRVIAQGYRVVDEERHAVNYRSSVWGDYFIRNPILPHNYRVLSLFETIHLCSVLEYKLYFSAKLIFQN